MDDNARERQGRPAAVTQHATSKTNSNGNGGPFMVNDPVFSVREGIWHIKIDEQWQAIEGASLEIFSAYLKKVKARQTDQELKARGVQVMLGHRTTGLVLVAASVPPDGKLFAWRDVIVREHLETAVPEESMPEPGPAD